MHPLIEFNNEQIHTFDHKGRPCWLAGQISVAIGYVNRGRISAYVRGHWAEEFEEGQDFQTLRGQEMRDFKRLNGDILHGGMPLKGVSMATILFEPGVFRALTLSELPTGKELRRVLSTEVLPQIARDGQYSGVRTVTQRGEMVNSQSTSPGQSLRDLFASLGRLGTTPPEVMSSLAIRIAELETGLDAENIFRHAPAAATVTAFITETPQLELRSIPSPLRTATELGLRFKVSKQMVGVAANSLGWRDGGPGVSFAAQVLPDGRAVNVRYFDVEAAEAIGAELVRRGKIEEETP